MNYKEIKLKSQEAKAFLHQFSAFKTNLAQGGDDALVGLIGGLIANNNLTRSDIILEASRFVGAARCAEIVDLLDEWERPEEHGGLWHRDDREKNYQLYN